ncbi:hypothetical protein [uncultured Christiangramia sp.]|uniref:hypothetical protein n=1 Tax=uncultured Christiangramia sp. TaxID=503836 RepID=UPI0026031433|nr:hypothetical protein [uncultured Christiangramia sp.]
MTEENNKEEFVNKRGGDHSHIKGWGVDANPKNDPTYPMKHRTDEEIEGYSWERPEQQETDIEVLHSIERPNTTAVFGTAAPPSGLSGMIRRYAFKKSESSYGRWLPLVMADRIGIAEGILDDLKHGHIPNIFKERGWKSEWKYNRKNFVFKIATGVAITSAAVLLLSRNKKD